MTESQLFLLLLELGVLIFAARACGEVFHRFKQPPIVGEILAGILLGPSILGHFAPGVFKGLFPPDEGLRLVTDGIAWLSASFVLLVAGLEIELPVVWRQGRTALTGALGSLAAPLALGYGFALCLPESITGAGEGRVIFCLFLTTAMSITAVPVLARILMDLKLLKTDLGLVSMAAGVLNDLVGWVLLSMVVGMASLGFVDWAAAGKVLAATVVFCGFALTLGVMLTERAMTWIEANTHGHGGMLSAVLVLALLCGAAAAAIGVHAIFGALLAGIMLGESPKLGEHTREVIKDFIFAVFAPIFFASVGLRVDVWQVHNIGLLVLIIIVACVAKFAGSFLGARLGGMDKAEALSFGVAMNARGGMEAIVAMIGLELRIIGVEMFSILVIMAIVTSLATGPLLRWSVARKQIVSLAELLKPQCMLMDLHATDKNSAIRELVAKLVETGKLDDQRSATDAVLRREAVMGTGIGDGVAIPHGRLSRQKQTAVAFGRSKQGLDFNAPDGRPARLVFLIVSPHQDAGQQVQLMAELARKLVAPANRDLLVNAVSPDEVCGLFSEQGASA